ncbi:hypothetical protein MRBBS_2419 [Marinobacter sp. BSs20148]|nr:hypothetical protein MRBBS_2419 [Marinobacter sp. BSs20148]
MPFERALSGYARFSEFIRAKKSSMRKLDIFVKEKMEKKRK